jgi:predicted nucleotidyltransferase
MNMIDDMKGFGAENVLYQRCFDRRTVNELVSESSEIVVFGSRAVGVHNSDSDLDLLIVTPQKGRVFASGLDCVLIAPEEIDNLFWLGSELASHVAKYGNWIKGVGEWRFNVGISDRAISRKQKRISSLLRNAAQRWPRLHPVFQAKYRITIRRELQRLKLLSNRLPIPPTPLLDSEWQVDRDSATELLQLTLNVDPQKTFASELELLFEKAAL